MVSCGVKYWKCAFGLWGVNEVASAYDSLPLKRWMLLDY